jgi:hypothetical protein
MGEKKRRKLIWGYILPSSRSSFGIPKMPVINLERALYHPKTQKRSPAWIVKFQPRLLRIHFLGGNIYDVGIVDFNLPSN